MHGALFGATKSIVHNETRFGTGAVRIVRMVRRKRRTYKNVEKSQVQIFSIAGRASIAA